jgi:hypothetical protein
MWSRAYVAALSFDSLMAAVIPSHSRHLLFVVTARIGQDLHGRSCGSDPTRTVTFFNLRHAEPVSRLVDERLGPSGAVRNGPECWFLSKVEASLMFEEINLRHASGHRLCV